MNKYSNRNELKTKPFEIKTWELGAGTQLLTFQCWHWGRWGGSDRLWGWSTWPRHRCSRAAPRRSSATGGGRWATPIHRFLREDSPDDSRRRPGTLDSPVDTALSVTESIDYDPATARSALADFLCDSAETISKFNVSFKDSIILSCFCSSHNVR